MAFYDEERILEDADSLSVAEYLGLEIRNAGKRHQIYCPGHLERLGKVDSRMGSCYLLEDGSRIKGYHCYACDKTVSLPNMVMEIEDCDYKEALGIIADSIGGREHYMTSGSGKDFEEREKILSEQDLKVIGLLTAVSFDSVMNAYSSKEEIQEVNKKNQESDDEDVAHITLSAKTDTSASLETPTYLAVHHQTISLKSIFQEDPEFYYYLVRTKAKESMDKYKAWADCLNNPESKEYELLKYSLDYIDIEFDSEAVYDFEQIFNKLYAKSKEIFLSITPSMAGMEEEVEETKEVTKPKIRLDLFADVP